jgi:glycine dehydrogenase subunit 1
MSFVGLTKAEERTMLAQIGVQRFEDLLGTVPAEVLVKQPLPVAGPLSEIELRRQFGGWSRLNHADRMVSFMGGGLYDHYIPAALGALAMRSEFATAYTPYQPEVAQGSLTAIFEFQSMIAELTGMEVANASLYDGATAAVEAALLARHHTGRARVVASPGVDPHTLEVLRTYLGPDAVTVAGERGGVMEADSLAKVLGPDVACVVYAHPNFFGLLERPEVVHRAARAAGALAVAVCDPIALALLEPPGAPDANGEPGADMVVGEGQSLGNPPSFGGPVLGFFACRQALVRRMPGRLAAQTVDAHGRRGFVLTLQTREQHIRREKATSNICTNQGLLALRATIYMGLLGREGLREVAELCVQKTHHAARLAAAIPGYALAHPGAFFREFVLECPVDAARVIEAGRAEDILPGVDLGQFRAEWKRRLLVAVTEQRSAAEIERWAALLARAGRAS